MVFCVFLHVEPSGAQCVILCMGKYLCISKYSMYGCRCLHACVVCVHIVFRVSVRVVPSAMHCIRAVLYPNLHEISLMCCTRSIPCVLDSPA